MSDDKDLNTKLIIRKVDDITPEIQQWVKDRIDKDAHFRIEYIQHKYGKKQKVSIGFYHFSTIRACNTFLEGLKNTIKIERPDGWVESKKSKNVMTLLPPPMVSRQAPPPMVRSQVQAPPPMVCSQVQAPPPMVGSQVSPPPMLPNALLQIAPPPMLPNALLQIAPPWVVAYMAAKEAEYQREIEKLLMETTMRTVLNPEDEEDV